MHFVSHVRRFALVAALLTLSAAPALAAEAPPSPKARIDTIYDHVKQAAATAATQDELTQIVMKELDAFINYETFAARTLKTSWPGLTPAQKTTFIDRFKRLVIRTYAKKFQPKSEFAVEYRGEVAFTNPEKTDATVKTTVRGKKDVAADVDYLLAYTDGVGKGWLAYDIIVDEVSMALNWRQQFEKIIAKEGFDALIAKINKKVDAQ